MEDEEVQGLLKCGPLEKGRPPNSIEPMGCRDCWSMAIVMLAGKRRGGRGRGGECGVRVTLFKSG